MFDLNQNLEYIIQQPRQSRQILAGGVRIRWPSEW